MHRYTSLRNSQVFSAVSRFFSITGSSQGRLDQRIAIITAGTEGIGLATAKKLAQEGAHVVVSSRNQQKVNAAVKDIKDLGLNASGCVCHVSDAEQRKELIESTVEKYGGIDILISHAGVNPHTEKFLDTPISVFKKVFDVNVIANFCLIRDVVPHMGKRGTQGAIVITSSTSGYLAAGLPTAYAISKAALYSMTRAFVHELIEENIRINCISYGVIRTKFSEVVEREEKLYDYVITNRTPMKRMGEPDECSGLAAFLCSDEASYITGVNYAIAGGMYTGL